VQVDELFDSNTELEDGNTELVGRAERAEIQAAQLKEQLEAALAQVGAIFNSNRWLHAQAMCTLYIMMRTAGAASARCGHLQCA